MIKLYHFKDTQQPAALLVAKQKIEENNLQIFC